MDLPDMNMDDFALPLHLAGRPHRLGQADHRAELLKCVPPDDQIGDAGFVFQGDEHHPRGRAGSLAAEHDTGDGHVPAQRAAGGVT